MKYESKRHEYEVLRHQLENERSSFLSHWRELGDYILPRRPRFTITDVNKGDRRNHKIIDSTATMAVRTLSSGMMSGVTSPARPWFRLTTPDPAMAEMFNVKAWLFEVSNRINTIFLRSNLYNVLPTCYSDMGVFGTAAMFVEEDFEDVMRFFPMPIGSYYISNNSRLKVDTFIREFQMTVRQLIERFGYDEEKNVVDWSRFSHHVKNQYDQGLMEAWIDVIHVVKPNSDYKPGRIGSKYKKYVSCYYERGSDGKDNSYMDFKNSLVLSEKGYDYFPILCPRWEVTGEDAWGTNSPGMIALGDVKQLQLGERRMMQAIEKMINPPLVGPTDMRQSKVSSLPGDITYYNMREGFQGLRPIHEVQPRVQELAFKQQEVQMRIKRAFFEDLFLMLASTNRRQITAREIDERHEEKLLALGPVLEQLNQDLLDPLIDIAFDIGMRQNQFPEPPEELQGIPLKIEYTSIMAQAQKLVGISGLERFTSYAGGIAQFKPEALDKLDADQMIDVYGDAVGVVPTVIRSDDQVAEMRAQRAQQQQQMQQQMQSAEQAKMAKDLSQADLESDNALNRMISNAEAGNLIPQG